MGQCSTSMAKGPRRSSAVHNCEAIENCDSQWSKPLNYGLNGTILDDVVPGRGGPNGNVIGMSGLVGNNMKIGIDGALTDGVNNVITMNRVALTSVNMSDIGNTPASGIAARTYNTGTGNKPSTQWNGQPTGHHLVNNDATVTPFDGALVAGNTGSHPAMQTAGRVPAWVDSNSFPGHANSVEANSVPISAHATPRSITGAEIPNASAELVKTMLEAGASVVSSAVPKTVAETKIETILSGQEFEESVTRSWQVVRDLPVSPATPHRIYPINLATASKTVSDETIEFLYHLLNQTEVEISSLVRKKSSNGNGEDENDHGEEPSLSMYKIVAALAGVPVLSDDESENICCANRDLFLQELKDHLNGDGKLVCKILLVMEIWIFGHPEAPSYALEGDRLMGGQEGRVVRWIRNTHISVQERTVWDLSGGSADGQRVLIQEMSQGDGTAHPNEVNRHPLEPNGVVPGNEQNGDATQNGQNVLAMENGQSDGQNPALSVALAQQQQHSTPNSILTPVPNIAATPPLDHSAPTPPLDHGGQNLHSRFRLPAYHAHQKYANGGETPGAGAEGNVDITVHVPAQQSMTPDVDLAVKNHGHSTDVMRQEEIMIESRNHGNPVDVVFETTGNVQNAQNGGQSGAQNIDSQAFKEKLFYIDIQRSTSTSATWPRQGSPEEFLIETDASPSPETSQEVLTSLKLFANKIIASGTNAFDNAPHKNVAGTVSGILSESNTRKASSHSLPGINLSGLKTNMTEKLSGAIAGVLRQTNKNNKHAKGNDDRKDEKLGNLPEQGNGSPRDENTGPTLTDAPLPVGPASDRRSPRPPPAPGTISQRQLPPAPLSPRQSHLPLGTRQLPPPLGEVVPETPLAGVQQPVGDMKNSQNSATTNTGKQTHVASAARSKVGSDAGRGKTGSHNATHSGVQEDVVQPLTGHATGSRDVPGNAIASGANAAGRGREPSVVPGLLNLRHGRARPREEILAELIELQLTGLDEGWYLKLDFKYSSFYRNFRRYEEELYVLIDRCNGDEQLLDAMCMEYGI